jgi:hypothetical protein
MVNLGMRGVKRPKNKWMTLLFDLWFKLIAKYTY